MEIGSGKWLSQVEMEDPMFFPQIDYSFDDFNFEYFSSAESYSSYPNVDHAISHNYTNNNIHVPSCIEPSSSDDDHDFKRPLMKQLKTNSWISCCTTENIPSNPASSHIISFDNNSNSSPSPISRNFYADFEPKHEVSKTRVPRYAQDHVIAERKRREKLSQTLISLSALIPALKKTDKASVLGEAIKYLKQLQEQVTTLENQVAKKTIESAIFVRKTRIYADDETSSSGENFDSQSNKPFPEIEARVSGKDVLIRIHCERNKGCISNIVNEVEKLHLFVLNSNVLPFGQATFDITIVAQMEAEFSLTVKDLVKSLRLALLKFM